MSFPYITDISNAILGTDWSLPIPSFGVLLVTAIIVSAYVARREVKQQELRGLVPESSHAVVGDLALVSAVAGIVGARVFHIADYPSQFVEAPTAMLLSRSGFSIYGGLLFGVSVGIVFLKRRAIPIAPMLDAVAPAMMLGYGLGRLGCQVAEDGDWGIPADLALKPAWLPDWLWAQTYDGNVLGVTILPPGVYPTPLYEFAAAVGLFGVLCTLRLSRHRAGFLFSMYLLLAGFERLLIEKIRANVEHDVLGVYLTQAEIVSLVLIVAGLAGVLARLRPRAPWTRALFALVTLSALTACSPL